MIPLRFALAIALALLTLSGCGKPATREVTDEEPTIAFVEKLGGTVQRDDKRPGKPVLALTQHAQFD
jgi:hypothetical protein